MNEKLVLYPGMKRTIASGRLNTMNKRFMKRIIIEKRMSRASLLRYWTVRPEAALILVLNIEIISKIENIVITINGSMSLIVRSM